MTPTRRADALDRLQIHLPTHGILHYKSHPPERHVRAWELHHAACFLTKTVTFVEYSVDPLTQPLLAHPTA